MVESNLKTIDKVSIVLLSYNNLEYLEECFNSIVKQTYKNIEVVLSDDCSRNIDKNSIILRVENVIKNSTINVKYIFHDVNVGTVKNSKNAILNSSGDIIIPLAIDDLLYDNNTVENIVNYFNNNDCLIASSIRANFNEEGKIISYRPTSKQKELFNNKEELLQDILKFGNFIGGCNTYYRKELFKEVGYFDESYRLLEDFPYYIKILEKGINIPLIDIPCLKYRYGGVSNSGFHPAFLDDMKILYDRLLADNYSKEIKKYIKYNKYFMFTSSKIKKIIYACIHFRISISKYLHSKKNNKE